MVYKNLRTRIKDAEAGIDDLDREFQKAIHHLLDYMERNWSEEERQAFWRTGHHEFEMKTDPTPELCGDQPYTEEDKIITMRLVEATPIEYFNDLHELINRGAKLPVD